jgi:membrane protein DedA with SNARE-associated domain
MPSEHTLVHLIETYGSWLIGVVTGLEAMGLPLPAESMLVATGVYAGTTGHVPIISVVVAAAVGAIVGDNVGYLIGRMLGHRALQRWGRHVSLTDDRQILGRYLFKRHGAKMVVFGRFVAILRTFVAVLAGANQMPWPRFLVANAVGGIAWACLYGFGAYALGEQVKHIAGPVGIALAVITAMLIGAAILYVRKHEHRLIEQAKREMHCAGR